MWTSLDVTTLLTHILFVFIQITNDFTTDEWHVVVPKKWYLTIWVIALGLVVASGVMYFGQEQGEEYFIVATVLYIVNIILVKIWVPLFFSKDAMHMGTALFVSIVMVFTSATLIVMLALDNALTSILVMYGIYVAWSIYVVFSTYQWFIYTPEVEKTEKKLPPRPMPKRTRTARTRRLRGTIDV